MKRFKHVVGAFVLLLTFMAFGQLAHAQATRTWVSGVGDDSNPCSRTAPCRTYAGALPKTATAGEIDALDPGSYGTFLITKSITINGINAPLSGVTVSSGTGITVNAPNSVVHLRGLTINGLTDGPTLAGAIGINVVAANSVYIDDCQIANFSQQGINFNLTSTGFLFVKRVDIRNCLNGGINVATTSGTARATIEQAKVDASYIGYRAGANAVVNVRDSSASANGVSGFQADPGGILTLDRCMAVNNVVGVRQIGSAAPGPSAGQLKVGNHSSSLNNFTSDVVTESTTASAFKSDGTFIVENFTLAAGGAGTLTKF